MGDRSRMLDACRPPRIANRFTLGFQLYALSLVGLYEQGSNYLVPDAFSARSLSISLLKAVSRSSPAPMRTYRVTPLRLISARVGTYRTPNFSKFADGMRR